MEEENASWFVPKLFTVLKSIKADREGVNKKKKYTHPHTHRRFSHTGIVTG